MTEQYFFQRIGSAY